MELFTGGAQNLPLFAEQPGPGCLANIRQMPEKGVMSGSGSSSLSFVNFNHQLAGQNSSTASMRRDGQVSGFIDHSNQATGLTHESRPLNDPHQALVDKMLHEMASNQEWGIINEPHYGESSIAASVVSNSVSASRAAGC
ncbi:hypothetical protein PHJA_001681500 [Phtheirospermum japonicum]|uniref:Uncharacterized protein n=1 Tax=Phtheirospermum japonicum TaxID=374723 RepID=A0A830CAT1_9LAMI|nr:hypothetical protein PHJA_001681500 [Phtheirospermum japonicum]